MMLSRSAISRNAPRALQSASRRGMASAAPQGLQYDVSESAGVKVANREPAGVTGTLALVAKAGSRYEPFPGFSDALELFAFQSTLKRSALRITREVELLGGEFSSTHSRENIVLKTKFLANDLPYFVELLAEVASQTKFPGYELDEVVSKLLKLRQVAIANDPEAIAVDAAHGVAFHQGLGNSISPSAHVPYEKTLSAEAIAEFAKNAYAKSNIALVGSGVSSSELSKWVGDFFKGLPSAGNLKSDAASTYYGGEQRISTKAGNSVVIAFPGSGAFGTAAYKPAASVLAALLGGESSIKWTPGFSLLSQATQGFSQLGVSTKNFSYSDAGLLAVSLNGKADQVASAGKSVVDVLKKAAAGEIPADEIKKASALAKFRALESAQTLETGLELTGSGLINGSKPYQIAEVAQSIDSVTEAQVKDAAKSFLSGKASVASVGDLSQLPYASDLGLTV
ncbi:ubiquinol--cytochrome-c reductase subunit 2 [Aspergillus puulaauensis]|uniref:Cytochrome b-c1 complex subunit 2, mitochondrial n=1 Tax=Aspergillus puulaauensis TaxID=1220207 RepID=A0A7R8AQL9_9EURO|nr:ubiquinol-cytochrome c reductase core subunit 1 [Aspergillus puulaauensis]BCS27521.1 ubiquinol-cytochrome c reductase core subunit 1 [Aspergillus puulaauensis]